MEQQSEKTMKNEMGIIKEGNPKPEYQSSNSSNNEIKVEYEQRAKKK